MADIEFSAELQIESARAIANLHRQLDKVDEHTINVDANTKKLITDVKRAVAAAKSSVKVDADTSAARAKIAAIRGTDVRIGVNVDQNGASRAGRTLGDTVTRDANGRLREARGKFVSEGEKAGDGYSGGFSSAARKKLQANMKGITQLVAFTPTPQIPAYFGLIAAAAAPASYALVALASSMGLAASSAAALAPALLGAASSAGALIGALSGPISAFKAFNAMQDQASSSAASSASSQKASAKAVQGAYEAVADARKRQAREMEDANDRLADSNKRVIAATVAVKNAEKALSVAREEAKRQLEDLAGAARDSANQQEAAAIRLERAQAKVNYFKQFEGMKLTADMALELREAKLDLAEAEADVANSNLTAGRAQTDYNKALKAGIKGSQQVVDAQASIADAVDSLKEAQKDQARTQRDVARAQEDAAIAVARAIQGVADAQDSAAGSAGSASAAANKYQQELAKLSPAGREFVKALIEMGKELDKTKRIAETAVLPGFTRALRNLKDLMPFVNDHISKMGTQIGRGAEEVSKFTQTALFRGRLLTIMSENEKASKSFADSLVPLTDIFTSISAAAAPLVSRFAAAFKNTAATVAEWLKAKEASGALAKYFKDAGDELAKWWNIGKNLVGAFIDVLRAGNPDAKEFATSLESATASMRAWTSSDMGQAKIKSVMEDLKNFSASLLEMIPTIAKVSLAIAGLTVAIKGLGLVTSTAGLITSLSNPIGIVAVAVLALAGGIVYLVAQSQELRDKLRDLWKTVDKELGPVFDDIKESFEGFAGVVKDALSGWLGLLVDEFKNRVIPSIKEIAEIALPALQSAFDRLKQTYIDHKEEFDKLGKLIAMFVGSGVIGAFVVLIGAMVAMVTVSSYVVSAIGDIYSWLSKLSGLVRTDASKAFTEWKNQVAESFNTVKSIASSAWDSVKNTFSNSMTWITGKVEGFKSGIVRTFESIRDSIGNAFRSIPEKALSGLNAVIKILDNLGKKVSDAVPGVNIPRLNPMELPAFASGGQVYGKGTGTSDSVLAKVSRGEYILRAKAVAALKRKYGENFLQRMNHFDVVGGDMSSGAKIRPTFKNGGDVSAALDLLKKYNGRPYIFGGALPAGTDCSGWVGSAWAAALGKNPLQRYFTTASVLNTGKWAPGAVKNGFNINLVNGGPGGGHISGELAGHRFESGGSHGYCAYEGPSTSIGSFGQQYHSTEITGSKNDLVRSLLKAITGPLRDQLPDMPGMLKNLPKAVFDLAIDGLSRHDFDLFDQGGILKDGALGINKSGKPEAVLTNDEYKMFKELVSGRGREQNITLNYHGGRPDLDTQLAIRSDLRKIARTVAV